MQHIVLLPEKERFILKNLFRSYCFLHYHILGFTGYKIDVWEAQTAKHRPENQRRDMRVTDFYLAENVARF